MDHLPRSLLAETFDPKNCYMLYASKTGFGFMVFMPLSLGHFILNWSVSQIPFGVQYLFGLGVGLREVCAELGCLIFLGG